MRAFQLNGCLSAVIRAVFITESLLTIVRGDGADSEETLDIKYVLIGGGIGLFVVAGFIIFKVCMIRKQVDNINNIDGRLKRPSEPHVFTLNPLSQSEHALAAVSNDMRC